MRRDDGTSNNDMAHGESEARLRSILDAANVIAWEVNLVDNSVHSTGPVRRMLDRPEGPVPTDFAAMIATIHPEDRDRVMAQFWAAVRTATTYRLEFRLHRDRLHWVTAEGSIERDVDGRPVRVRGITQDITKRKKAEEKLRKSESEMRELLRVLAERNTQFALAEKSALVGSFAYDVGTDRLQISDGYAAIHGFPNETKEIPRSRWLAGVHPEDRARVDELRSRAFTTRSPEYSADFRIVRPGGEVRWIEGRAFVSYRDDGSPQRVAGVNIDVTERKRVEEQQGKLVAELDHRVKNVLATVQAVAARTMQTSSSMEHFVAALDGRIRSMASTHELLSHRRWVGIPLAELVKRELAPYATGSNAEISGPDVVLSAEAGQTMGMVLHELVTNAAKYGALSLPSGRVSIRWRLPLNGSASDRLIFMWRETGGPLVVPPSKSGYGMNVVRELVPYELGGTVDLLLAPEGVRCQMEIPLARLSRGSSQDNGLASPSSFHASDYMGGLGPVEA